MAILSTNPVKSQPILSGVMRESADYRFLGVGTTDRIFLIGHANGIRRGDIHQVVNLQTSIDLMGGDITSPLLNAMLQTYSAGGRDIYLISAAPMVEYVPATSDRLLASSSVTGKTVAQMRSVDSSYTYPSEYSESQWNAKNFYERYYVRLQSVYSFLVDNDLPQILVPLETSFCQTGTVDFITQLMAHCNLSFWNTGTMRFGFMGSKSTYTSATQAYDAIMADERFPFQSFGGKFITLFFGESIVSNLHPQLITNVSPVHIIAGKLSTIKANRGLVYQKIPNVVSTVSYAFTKAQLENLAQKGINVIGYNTLGNRGRLFNAIVLTDNTLAATGSDYWSLGHIRLAMLIIERLRALGKAYIGTIGYPMFKEEVRKFMTNLKVTDILKDYNLTIDKRNDYDNTVIINVALQPYFGIRTIQFTTEVGPGVS